MHEQFIGVIGVVKSIVDAKITYFVNMLMQLFKRFKILVELVEEIIANVQLKPNARFKDNKYLLQRSCKYETIITAEIFLEIFSVHANRRNRFF